MKYGLRLRVSKGIPAALGALLLAALGLLDLAGPVWLWVHAEPREVARIWQGGPLDKAVSLWNAAMGIGFMAGVIVFAETVLVMVGFAIYSGFAAIGGSAHAPPAPSEKRTRPVALVLRWTVLLPAALVAAYAARSLLVLGFTWGRLFILGPSALPPDTEQAVRTAAAISGDVLFASFAVCLCYLWAPARRAAAALGCALLLCAAGTLTALISASRGEWVWLAAGLALLVGVSPTFLALRRRPAEECQ